MFEYTMMVKQRFPSRLIGGHGIEDALEAQLQNEEAAYLNFIDLLEGTFEPIYTSSSL